MRRTEKRDMEVISCDFCGRETPHVEKCSICGKEGCPKDGGKAHFAYSISEIYRYKDDKRNSVIKICVECAEKDPISLGKKIADLIDALFRK